ncbi:hypothetical protein J7E93_07405 [Streptomyces sp. ISL-36]|uniref:hypothetical protein n=1 Tax=Streptomyces sp. ISL-36 TaxID=2819182 RepID=UPI001BEA15F6|nr:hypothetical protein [Streptomyces sp. ISL-36]MBT2439950.1 hypothetical protein [Streptomyces sp. ISL-36]
MNWPRRGRPRTIRSFAHIPYGTPLVWQAAWLYKHAWRLAQRERGDAGTVDDALAVLALTTNLYHSARWDGVRQAVRTGATVEEVAFALGMSIHDARDLVRRIEERDRDLKQYRERQANAGT